MNRICLLAGILWGIFSGCTPEKGFSLHANLPAEMEGKTVYLMKMGAEAILSVDTARVKKGRFVMKKEDTPEGVYYLTSDSKPFVFLYLQPQKTELRIDTLWNPERIVLKGGNQTAIFHSFMTSYSRLSQASTLDQLDFCRSFAAQYSESPVGVFLMYAFLEARIPDQELEAMVQKVDSSLSENEYLLAVRRYLISREDIMEGSPFKDFSALDENKKTHRLDEIVGKGNLVLLHFWSSWCAPCREELQNLKVWNIQFGRRGLDLLGVSVDNAYDAWKKALEEEDMPWAMWRDSTGMAVKAYHSGYIPFYVLFSRDGKILAKGNNAEDIASELTRAIRD